MVDHGAAPPRPACSPCVSAMCVAVRVARAPQEVIKVLDPMLKRSPEQEQPAPTAASEPEPTEVASAPEAPAPAQAETEARMAPLDAAIVFVLGGLATGHRAADPLVSCMQLCRGQRAERMGAQAGEGSPQAYVLLPPYGPAQLAAWHGCSHMTGVPAQASRRCLRRF